MVDTALKSEVGVVVIGRNEGPRLKRCLESLVGSGVRIVYVDSASTDGSAAIAKSLGAEVVELDPSVPCTAPRARNAGFERIASRGDCRFVQFVDGDCEMEPHWMPLAAQTLGQREDIAIVCGRLRERHPENSVFNRLCDMEWHVAPGEIDASGGIFMMRTKAFQAVGGFNPALIGGGEPEMCVRLRCAGWKVLAIEHSMATHDAAMHRFRQWWKRNVRAGHAYAEGCRLHGRGPTRFRAKECRSNWFWGALLPCLAVALAWLTRGISLALLAVYPLQVWRIARYRQRAYSDPPRHAWLYGAFTMLGKIPSAQGQAMYWFNRWRGAQAAWIEYKQTQPASVVSQSSGTVVDEASEIAQRLAAPDAPSQAGPAQPTAMSEP